MAHVVCDESDTHAECEEKKDRARRKDKNALQFVSLSHKKALHHGHHDPGMTSQEFRGYSNYENNVMEDAIGRQGAGGGGAAARGAGASTGKGGKEQNKMMSRLFRENESEKNERRFQMHIS